MNQLHKAFDIIRLLATKPTVKTNDLQELFGYTDRQAQKDIKKIVENFEG